MRDFIPDSCSLPLLVGEGLGIGVNDFALTLGLPCVGASSPLKNKRNYGTMWRVLEPELARQRNLMAICQHCGKHAEVGMNVSHSKHRTKRRFYANLQHVKVFEEGKMVRKTLCTKCIKTLNKV